MAIGNLHTAAQSVDQKTDLTKNVSKNTKKE
jgi:hypothetical protein